ncbi:MAG: 50S ribosomal protein L6 [Candidatus Dadabacteria bacterium]|nr:50S ribosomal protein L6 [Candidatus Dadabacteria bacterium]MCY4042678.1 50S ribosomal protein L6 [Candidatus Dadabacteria bacterium]
MSRIGNKPIPVPDKVEIARSGDTLKVKGPRGELEVAVAGGLNVEVADGFVTVKAEQSGKGVKASHGLVRMLIANSIQGVTEGFARTLEIVGTGYKAELAGKDALKMSLGYSHPIEFPLPEGVKATVEARGTRLTLEGIDKQVIGETAANIRKLRAPDSYKGKGVRFSTERIRLKPGKSGGAAKG